MVQIFPENGGRPGARFLPVMSFANNANATPVINHCSLRPRSPALRASITDEDTLQPYPASL